MTESYSSEVQTAQSYYNSDDADNFYYHIWGGEDIHIGTYNTPEEDIAKASENTVSIMASLYLKSLAPTVDLLDIGAGYGGAARWLAKHHGCNVTCLNLSTVQNERNRTMNIEQSLNKQINVLDGNFEDIPLPEKSFDLVWSQDSILHSSKRDRVLEEIDRVLKSGGEFLFTDPMQADNCPAGVLAPVLNRIHLDSLGSFSFYREQAKKLGWEEVKITDLTPQLVNHYRRVREELSNQRSQLTDKISAEYIDRMIKGLGHWIDAGSKDYLSWGIMHFRKP